MSIRLLIKEHPHRAIALATQTHVLIFRHSPSSTEPSYNTPHNNLKSSSQTSLTTSNGTAGPRCMVEFAELGHVDLEGFRQLNSLAVHGTLGLMSVEGDVFLCVVSGAGKVARVREDESVLRIHSVEFHCLNRTDYDRILSDDINPYPTESLDDEVYDHGYGRGRGEALMEHPCVTLKKLLSSGTFYYSADFDLTRRVQERSTDTAAVALDSLDAGFLWNSYMIQPLVNFRSRLSPKEKIALDGSKLLTSAIRGFVSTIPVPASSSPARNTTTGLPSTLTLISRLSCRRAGTRFNSRGIDDDGNVANFVETETVFCTPSGLCFSYTQIRGSVPIFWEQATGLLPNQQKISITRSQEATQPSFDRHFEHLEHTYGAVHVVNLLSFDKPQETDLTQRYIHHIEQSPLNNTHGKQSREHDLLKHTEYDFHAETRGPVGYEAASDISRYIQDSADSFSYYLAEEVEDRLRGSIETANQVIRRSVTILQQEGVFRTNCLDCLDRTNLVQTIISKMALLSFLGHRSERASNDFWTRHGSLWADNGDALSKIYAGTGALKSSFTRSGKMSFAGALADARKSAQRLYINNFADKGRQNTVDMLLGRLIGQSPVTLYDPVNDFVNTELMRRFAEYTSSDTIRIWAGTFNLNGKTNGLRDDLSPWLLPKIDAAQESAEIVAVGFQEIVELSPQQIMSTDPARRQNWESAVKNTLNEHARLHRQEEYVLLRGGQLVGASLSIFVKASILNFIKNVEGSIKKTGMSGIAGNKGAVAIRVDFADTSICFVTAHLAAGFANYEERNRDYKTIVQGLRFQRDRSIEDHDSVIWLGDFNYRIGLSNEKVRRLIEARDLETLYANDQLNLQMVAGLTFPYYNEARITFDPTYKFDLGTDYYDSSEKARIPAWCDRILTKGTNLRQTSYNAAPLRFSDHRPVYATFFCTINIIDEKKKDHLGNRLYRQRRGVVGDPTVNDRGHETSDEDLIGYESIEPGLPPASSDRRKWWIDNGQPVRSQVRPPQPNMIPNPNRKPNPFTPSSEQDWVDIRKYDTYPDPPKPRRSNTTASARSNMSSRSITRKIPPPFDTTEALASSSRNSNTSSHHYQVSTPPSNRDARSDSRASVQSPYAQARSPSSQSISSTSITRKPAPPVPKKPAAFSSSSSPTPPLTESFEKIAPTLPPPRRTVTSATSGSSSNVISRSPPQRLRKENGSAEERTGPALPPRRKGTGMMTAGPMDDSVEDEMKEWEVLRPS
ncbi:hypothetical protein EJ05DRAFT_531518 [Pseudovirgaria hyperparasitica]|uniref:phosphoinositide 5-phosphatase n=1 Tax=Pseudovirgaria hyperparasitica TaxID=470096 RepID=A0A6A6WC39_9PEZI|nr:uncharacterized protein EJ05DRAFT_531518 [Pseudovirgaria hyperparasitica]KAF2759416.1 hypothetical protein EJ05DRAFT_531518 [Pseudovirgaria hyperparasitica]